MPLAELLRGAPRGSGPTWGMGYGDGADLDGADLQKLVAVAVPGQMQQIREHAQCLELYLHLQR